MRVETENFLLEVWKARHPQQELPLSKAGKLLTRRTEAKPVPREKTFASQTPIMTLKPTGRRIRIPVNILGQAYFAMIDTGAEVSFIGKSVVEDCRRHQVPYNLDEQDGVLADGRTVPIDFTYKLTVNIGPRKITATFNALEELIVDVVFGMDILATQHFRLDFVLSKFGSAMKSCCTEKKTRRL